MKRVKQVGIGSDKCQPEPLSPEEEELLWKKGILGDHSPQALLNSVFFFNGVCFALRGGDEHRTDNCASRSVRFKWWRSQESEPTLYIRKTPQRTTREDSKATSSRQNKLSTMKILLILPGAQCGYSSSTKVCALKFLKKMLSTFSH